VQARRGSLESPQGQGVIAAIKARASPPTPGGTVSACRVCAGALGLRRARGGGWATPICPATGGVDPSAQTTRAGRERCAVLRPSP
jgi:hypothetical protein